MVAVDSNIELKMQVYSTKGAARPFLNPSLES